MSSDPFADDPEAYERERRRAEREAARRARSERRSLGARVGGALDGAAAKGRGAVEEGRRRAAARAEPPAEAAAPPPLRRTAPRPDLAAPAQDDSPAPSRPAGPTAAEPAVEARPQPVAGPQPAARRAGTAPGAGGSSAGIWRRRLLALGALVVLALGAAVLIAKSGNEEPPPVPKGPATLKTISVTIPEGLAREDMVAIAKDAGLAGSYEAASAKAPKGFDLAGTGAPADASLEGFLFPATYELEKGAPAEDLVQDQLAAFEDNLSEVDLGAAKRKNLTTYDVVTIASMIEREVAVPKERPLVAAVIYNRLADGEPLFIDATLRYEVGFDEPLTESQLESDSPYNTRTNPGLPPTPIGNPGLDSLEAAANPADVDFKYYVIKPGTCNEHTFTADYDEFLAAQADYQAALEAEGGSPTEC